MNIKNTLNKNCILTKLACVILILTCHVFTISGQTASGLITVNRNPSYVENGDCTIMTYNGNFYLHLSKSPNVLVSSDMVRWSEPHQVFRTNNIWTPQGYETSLLGMDMKYYNGVFHMNWRQWGLHDMGHAISETPLGPYVEPDPSSCFVSGGLATNLFRDTDGQYYLYWTYTRRHKKHFLRGNENWSAPMADPSRWYADKQRLNLYVPQSPEEGLPSGHFWENIDGSCVIENPYVFHYRDSYYQAYSANHTSYNSYAVGIARIDDSRSPIDFSNADKLPDPVLERSIFPNESKENEVTNMGQTTIIRGPNGFRWWMMNKATAGNTKTWHTFIEPLYFFYKTPHTDGPVWTVTPGYHPWPYQPTFADFFENDQLKFWDYVWGNWSVKEGEAQPVDATSNVCKMVAKSTKGTHYLVEADLKIESPVDQEPAGISAYFKDDQNYFDVLINPAAMSGTCRYVLNGIAQVKEMPLPQDFNKTAYHTIRVERNGKKIRWWIDELELDNSKQIVDTEFDDEARVGLVTASRSAKYDRFIYTLGWDEWDDRIAGWGNSKGAAKQSGKWELKDGLTASPKGAVAEAFKGDMIPEYEFSAQVTIRGKPDDGGKAGIYGVYQDENNFLKGELDPQSGMFEISGKHEGVEINVQKIPLPNRWLITTSKDQPQAWNYTFNEPDSNWADQDYDDSGWNQGKAGFGFGDKPKANMQTTWNSDQIWLRKTFNLSHVPRALTRLWMYWDNDVTVFINGVKAFENEGKLDDIFPSFDDYISCELSDSARRTLHPGENVIAVKCTKTSENHFFDAGLFVPKYPETKGMQDYNIRVVKRRQKVIWFVNDLELAHVDVAYGPSQVGLCTNHTETVFNGMNLIGIGSQYGINPSVNFEWSDNFNDCLLGLDWLPQPVHATDPKIQLNDVATNITFFETNQRLQIQGYELGGNDSISWYMKGLRYNKPISGSRVVSLTFDGLMTRSNIDKNKGGAIGLRLWKDDDNWIEIRQTNGTSEDQMEVTKVSGGVSSTWNKLQSKTAGKLTINFNAETKQVSLEFDNQEIYKTPLSNFVENEYYALVTAYTKKNSSKDLNYVEVNVDDFVIQKKE